jgi:hypothetical protein
VTDEGSGKTVKYIRQATSSTGYLARIKLVLALYLVSCILKLKPLDTRVFYFGREKIPVITGITVFENAGHNTAGDLSTAL